MENPLEGFLNSQPVPMAGIPATINYDEPSDTTASSLLVPVGLEYLSQVDQLLIQQQVELMEVLVGIETNNKYLIKNSMGQQVYFAKESSDCCSRQCCGPIREFDMKIKDNLERDVINIHRPLRCSCCCCCLQELEVMGSSGLLGTIIQEFSFFIPEFTVKNAAGEAVLKITGPCLACNCCSDVDFEIWTVDKSVQVGKITKQWTGLVREAFTDADNFGVSFPMDLDVKVKATLLGAVFLIDFMYFEQPAN